MEDDFDSEAIRLKKLLEDNILKVEKENLELIRTGSLDPFQCSKNIQVSRKQQPTSSSSVVASRTNRLTCVKSAPTNVEKLHTQSPQCSKHSNSRTSSCANIHFLNGLQSSLLVSNLKKRVLQNEAKSRYIPCAVPLSPPIRIRKEDNLPFLDETPTLLNVYHNSNHSSQGGLKKKLVIQNLPGITITDEHRSNTLVINENIESPIPSEKFSSVPIRKDVHQNSPDSFTKSPASEKYESLKLVKDYLRNTSDTLSKVRFNSSENAASFSNTDSSSSPNKRNHVRFNQSTVEEPVSQASNKQKLSDDNSNCGFNLHISLDSFSTKDVVNQLLQKIPEFINGQLSSNNASTAKPSSTEKKNCEDNLQSEFVTQPNSTKSFENFTRHNQCVSTSTQADLLKEKFQNQTELRNLVKDVVLDTLKDMNLPEQGLYPKPVPTCLKIDSGIQSEIETDVDNSDKTFKVQFPGNGVLLNDHNASSLEQISVTSKGIQVCMNPIQILKGQSTDENCKKETSYSSAEHSDINVLRNFQNLDEREDVLEKTTSVSHEPQKLEQMLEKIYQHICQEKEVSHNYPAISQSCSIVTRDVAVQFNPLHTSTKGTITSEIRSMDSSCQYDNPLEDIFIPKSYANTSVQATTFVDPCDNHHDLQVNAYTQCETKTFDRDVQTEIMNSEYSATNTSVSSTPVSDSMFIDDLLSEGEITLPWNLRLLSLSDRGAVSNMTTTDSSDISIKEKDYSLSEGEIHPNIVHNLNMCQNNHSEENDFHHNIYSSRQTVDSKLQHTPRSISQNYSGFNSMCSSNMHRHLSSPLSEGEMNSNASLSLGEVPPGFMVPLAASSPASGNFSPQNISHSCDKFSCDYSASSGHTQMADLLPHSLCLSSISENEVRSVNEGTNLPTPVLPTVYEETSATCN